MVRKPSIGRQKIEIAKILDKNHLQVTFSKRRAGLFKKASELCTLCGAEVVVVVFSPADKVFSFGHPDVETVMDRFFARINAPPPQPPRRDMGGGGTVMRLADHRSAGAQELNAQLTHALGQLEAEKRRGEALGEAWRAGQRQFWWEAPLEELGLQELEQLRAHLEDLKKNVAGQAHQLYAEAAARASNAPFLGMNGMVGPIPMGMVDFSYESKPFDDLNNAAAAAAAAALTLSRVHNYGYYNGGDGLF